MAKLNILELRQSREIWESINTDTLSPDVRSQYFKRKTAVDLYIDGISLKKISEETGVLKL